MLRVVVCGDTKEECDFIVECASVFFERRQMAVHIDTYEKGGELMGAGQEHDLYLLNVLMPGLTGIETAARLGKGNYAVVFITPSLEAAVDGYSVSTAGPILKPVERNHFGATMERMINQCLGEREACISIIHNHIPVYLKLERIAWFENRLHRVLVTLTSEETLATGQKLSELQEELKEHPQFLCCHQGHVVNLEQVEWLEDSCSHMREGQLIPISRNFYKQSKNAYYHHRLKRGFHER